MANMTKIKKSKFLSYQKQRFLYLVLNFSFFFSQALEYVMHCMSLAKMQKALKSNLKVRPPRRIHENDGDNQHSNDVLNAVASLVQIGNRFKLHESMGIAGFVDYRENQFAECRIPLSEWGTMFKSPRNQQQSQLSSDRLTKILAEPLIISING